MKRFIITVLFCCAAFPAFAGMKEGDAALKKEDYKTAIKEFTALANKGEAEAQFKLGLMYAMSIGVKEDLAKAFSWYLKAANQNHPQAAHIVSVAYDKGQGVKEDKNESIKWLTKAAELGLVKAQLQLGDQYYSGEGVPKDLTKAFEWFLKAAEQNDALAQFYVGQMYLFGEGMAVNNEKAIPWIEKSAGQNYFDAQVLLGKFYMQNSKFADGVKWLKVTASQGHVGSINYLGMAYSSGDGVPKDLIKAYRYFHIASHFGRKADPDAAAAAQISKDNLSSQLSDDVKKQAEARAAGFAFEGEMRQKSLE
jgi:TPR repeat protein